jgi:hypothetical protein
MNAKLLQEVWTRMLAIYGHRWDSQYGRTPDGVTGETWGAALCDLEPRQVGNGLDACLRAADGDWPPSLPTFRSRCLGIPTLAFVQADITRDKGKRHAFTRMVWGCLDAYAFTRESTDRAQRSLRDAYDLARERVMGGEPLPLDLTEIATDPDAADRQRAAELDAHNRHFGLGKYAQDRKTASAGNDW